MPWAGLALALAVAVPLALLDQQRLRAEVAVVDRCRTDGEAAAEQADRRLAAMWTYVAPARTRAGDDGGLAQRLMARAVDDVRPGVVDAAATCARASVRPWHPGTEAARANVEDYLLARLASLDRVAADPEAYARTDPDLALLRERAFPSGRAAGAA